MDLLHFSTVPNGCQYAFSYRSKMKFNPLPPVPAGGHKARALYDRHALVCQAHAVPEDTAFLVGVARGGKPDAAPNSFTYI